MRRRLRPSHGFSFLEMVVALAVLAAIVAFLAPTMLSSVGASREDATLTEMAQIYEAILGDQRQRFGYVGDVGDYPSSLYKLVSDTATGWRGPYMDNATVVNSMLVDPYGQPYEFYLVAGVSGSDKLAIISRGPDGQSTNTSGTPNVASTFAGTLPTNASYFSGSNADNIVYPAGATANANALNVVIEGTLAVNIQNFDSNSLVNAFVPACPNLYEITVTSQARGTNEVDGLGYAPGFEVDLAQGVYQVLVTAQNLSAAPFNERVTVIPGQTLTRSPNITGLDSSGTDQFVLTVTNKQPTEALNVYQFTTLLTPQSLTNPVPANGGVRSYSVRACSQVFIKASTGTAIRDQVVMPWSAVSKTVGGSAATLAVTNNRAETIRMFNSDIFFGEVRKGKSESFSVGLLAGDAIQSRTTTGTVLTSMTLVAGANTLTQN